LARPLALLLALIALPAFAVETKSWIQNEQSDFDKGTLTKLSLRSDGRLSLAPVFRKVLDSSTPYLWALAEDSKGNLYTGGGGPSASSAKVFAIDPSGKSRTLAEVPGMEVHSIAVNRRDEVFVSTAPDGKVYRIANGKPELFYDPKAKYIWAIAFNSKGDLFVATGDQGEIHRVTPDGKGSVFFRTEETHARSMAIDSADNLIVGTEPGGLIIRVSPAGEGFVLYQAAKREVTAVAVAKDGTIYATAIGNKSGSGSGTGTSTVPLSIPPIPPAQVSGGGRGGAAAALNAALSGNTATPISAPPPISGGSELYRIDRDNYPKKIWSATQDIAYAIGFDPAGRPVVGTGNKGKLYRIDSDTISTLLMTAQPTQITNLLNSREGKLYAACGNIGEVDQIGPGLEREGTFESEPFDVGSFSYWGRLTYKGEGEGGKVRFDTRSGNLDRPQKNWSPWAPVNTANGSRVTSPSARFLQYRTTLDASADGRSPEVTQVEIAYMSKNVPPAVDDIEITPANYRFPAPTTPISSSTQTLTLPAMGQRKRTTASVSLDLSSQTMNYAKGYTGARWTATDPNSDDLIYKIEIRGVNETEWKLLKDKVKERYITWDSTAYPDGWYVVRITASDSPSNPPGEALSNHLDSEPFLIDNTPPQITNLTGTRSGNGVNVRWRAKDALSNLDEAQYSVDGKDWTVVEPTTHLTDSPEHEYVLTIADAGPGEHTIAVRVDDEFDNQSVEKVVVK
jgi:sugar lactone lactonase YvrE